VTISFGVEPCVIVSTMAGLGLVLLFTLYYLSFSFNKKRKQKYEAVERIVVIRGGSSPLNSVDRTKF